MPTVKTLGPLALVATLTAGSGAALAATPEKRAPKPVDSSAVAVVGGDPITTSEFEQLAGSKLFAVRTQEYNQKRALLEEVIDKRLLEKEGKARGISADELVRVEVDSKVPAVTEAEQKDYYEKNKPRFGNTAEADALKQIESGLKQQRMRERQAAFTKELRDKAGVRILLDPPRVAVSLGGDDPVKGPATAPVTIVEFSDFQCPYCSRVIGTLKQVEEKYGDKLRVVFRDFPLTSIHKDAAKAAEAGACANEQGKFWEMHDKLFGNQSKLQVEGLKQSATEIGLDAADFNQCLDSGKYAAEWQKDVDEGTSYGVTGTPAFFINGRLLSGAQPLEAFTTVIDEELARVQPTTVARAGKK